MVDIPSPKPALWLRILQHPVVRFLLLGAPLFYMMGLSNGFMIKLAWEPLVAAATVVAMVAAALLYYGLFVRFIERRPVMELAFPGMGRELALGGLIGAGLYTICVLVLILLGIYRVDGLNPWTFLLPAIPMALSSGVFEELIFRGVLFRITEESFGSWVALAVSSLVFGLVHLTNPAGSLMGALFISVEAGVLLAAGYMMTRRLWLSIGFHISWNYTQSAIYSGIVSGAEAQPGLVKSTIQGPLVLTGGSFGLESSLIAFLVCTTTGVVLLIMAMQRGHIVAPWWSRTS